MRVHPLAPVVALDVDGTIADYYRHFRWFAELYLQKPVKIDWDYSDNAEFSEALNISKDVYRDIKLAYRQGGMKRSIPVLGAPHPEALSSHIQALRAAGIQVWIATTRPWQRLDNIDPDTQFWLRNNVGRVDGVVYGEEKYLDLCDIVGAERVLGVHDDLPVNIVTAMSLGLNAALHIGGHNQAFRTARPDVVVTDDAADIEIVTMNWFETWKKENAS
jgi:hypothetical protein